MINATGELGEYNVLIERPIAIPMGVTTAKVRPIKYGRIDFRGKYKVAIRAPNPIPSNVSIVNYTRRSKEGTVEHDCGKKRDEAAFGSNSQCQPHENGMKA